MRKAHFGRSKQIRKIELLPTCKTTNSYNMGRYAAVHLMKNGTEDRKKFGLSKVRSTPEFTSARREIYIFLCE